jgi:hypothetical protein
MSAKFALVALAFVLAFGSAIAQPDPKKTDDKKLVTTVYNVKPLIGERGKAGGLADTEAVIKRIFQTFPQLRESKLGADGPQIVECDDGKLEIRATADLQEQVKELLAAIERLQDLAIDLQTRVIELDAAGYEKLLKAVPKVGKGKLPVLFTMDEEVETSLDKKDAALKRALAEMHIILQAGRTVQTSSGRFVNGAESTVSARRTVVTFTNEINALGAKAAKEEPLFVKEGFGLVALPVVSADRRFVRFKLTEQSTVISGVRKRDFGEIAGEKVVFQTLDTEDLGATGSAVVADGGAILFKLAYAPKDKVWVVMLKPTIFIQAEEDALKREEKKP